MTAEKPRASRVVAAATDLVEEATPTAAELVEEPVETVHRHPSTTAVYRWFDYEHLTKARPREVSMYLHDTARIMLEILPDSQELTAGLRKLLEAKDCFVRAAVELGDDVADPWAPTGEETP